MSLDGRDSQRKRLYRWSYGLRTVEFRDRLTKEQCLELINLIHVAFKTPTPSVRFKKTRVGKATGARHQITLPQWACTSTVVVHECIHSVMDIPCNKHCAWHGPEFVRLFIETLVWLTGASKSQLVKSAREAGLHTASYKTCTPQMPCLKVLTPDDLKRAIKG